MVPGAFNFAAHHGVPHPTPRRPVVAVEVPVRVLPTSVTWKFVVTLDKASPPASVLLTTASQSMSDSDALARMTSLARQYAYDPATQGKGMSVTVVGQRWDGSTWQTFSTAALVSKQTGVGAVAPSRLAPQAQFHAPGTTEFRFLVSGPRLNLQSPVFSETNVTQSALEAKFCDWASAEGVAGTDFNASVASRTTSEWRTQTLNVKCPGR